MFEVNAVSSTLQNKHCSVECLPEANTKLDSDLELLVIEQDNLKVAIIFIGVSRKCAYRKLLKFVSAHTHIKSKSK